MIPRVTRRTFLMLLAALPASGLQAQADWSSLLPIYTNGALGNVVQVNGRRALLSSRLYPGTYVRDALFWGPLALNDPGLGYDCYQWFAESQLQNGQIRTAVPLRPEDAALLQPRDDEGTLLFIIASDWLRSRGCTLTTAASASTPGALDADRITRAYRWVEGHVNAHHYVSSAGAFRYWADTVRPNRGDVIAHNQGLFCLARRAMVNMGLGGVTEAQVQAAQNAWRALYDAHANYLPLGRYSDFARAQDTSAVFPEWLSRCLYNEPILANAMVLAHTERIIGSASVNDAAGRLAGIKVISDANGAFLSASWFYDSGLNPPGDYQNGGYWPMYTHVMLALAYSISRDPRYASMVEALVRYELESDGHSKEVICLSPGSVGTYEAARDDYTWNALIPVALRWAGIVS